ncbi:hypothetical protein MKZ38_005527 [Zalerion maritima]|uniref:SAM-dependent MTase RsmB/NOP-type domain-containing protein n=1 Tax=Zalerion maritima TaxID=339359 RepID=A0AAD5S3W9_9PEZI|nr:hypothetical protein MKZ38_005527 [Zalerion maritima]
MGRGGRGKWRGRGGNRGGGGGGGGGGGNRPYNSYPDIVKEHKVLESYYNKLLDFPKEEQEKFWATLRRELPNSFRFCGSKGHALTVRKLLQERYIPEISQIDEFEGRKFEPPKPVAFYPDDLAWWMTTPKQVIRRYPPFSAFQKFLVSETSVGNISRQEVVSMIPPLLMDVRPGMTVLDLCAAPGSKASQLLEMIHAGEEARIHKVMNNVGEDSILADDPSDDGRATGLLIANDADYKRAQMLIHQLKRISSPNMIVTNHDATMYPSIKLPSQPGDNPKQGRYLKFDRILADVPCSGDGTLRKNVTLWNEWNPNNAAGLHLTQSRILVRALQMLKVGGRVVYSTCSMNPIENEAVVYSAIERCGGLEKVDIIDCSNELPELKRRSGMKRWCVPDKQGRTFSSWKECCEAKDNDAVSSPDKFIETMFPREDGSESANVPIERCMRVYPHQQDTGAFFITVLEKKSEIKAKNENDGKEQPKVAANGASAQPQINSDPKHKTEEDIPTATATPSAGAQDGIATLGTKRPREDDAEEVVTAKRARSNDGVETEIKGGESLDAPMQDVVPTPKPQDQPRKPKGQGHNEDPFKYLSPDHEVLKDIKQFYKVSDKFPTDRYMVRNAMCEPAKAIYYSSALVRDIFIENESRAVKFVHGGVKLFVKQEAPSPEVCRWRIQSDGLPILEGYVGEERVVYLHNKQTLHKLLIEMFPMFKQDEWQTLGEIGARIRDIGMGCCVMRVEPTGDDPAFTERMVLPLWKSVHSLNLMLPKEDRSAMLLRIFNDTSPVVNLSLKKKEEQKKKQEEDGNIVKMEKEDGSPNGEAENKDLNDEMKMAEDAPTPADSPRGATLEDNGGALIKDHGSGFEPAYPAVSPVLEGVEMIDTPATTPMTAEPRNGIFRELHDLVPAAMTDLVSLQYNSTGLNLLLSQCPDEQLGSFRSAVETFTSSLADFSDTLNTVRRAAANLAGAATALQDAIEYDLDDEGEAEVSSDIPNGVL